MNARATVLLGSSALLLAACGSTPSAAVGTSPSAGRQPGAGRGGTFGQIVQVNGSRLTVSTSSGDVNVAYSNTTVLTTTSTGSAGDIVTGKCVVIAGLKDSTGVITASAVRLSEPVTGSCTPNAFPGGGGPRPSGGFSPPAVSAGATPRPTPNPNAAFVVGMVTAVSGTIVTVQTANASATSVTVPTTLSVTESSTATSADLTVNTCVRAIGQKDGQGVVQATALTLQPANSSGTCTAAGGGFPGGGFAGGGFSGSGGGADGFPAGGPPVGAPPGN